MAGARTFDSTASRLVLTVRVAAAAVLLGAAQAGPVGAQQASTVPATTTAASTTRVAAPPPETVPPPIGLPKRRGLVTDAAGIISSRNEGAVATALRAVPARAGTRAELIVVTQLPRRVRFDAFAAKAFETWNLGDVVRRDGILLLIVREPLSAEFVAGPGYEGRHDAALAAIVDRTLLPAIQRGEQTRGILSSIEEAVTVLRVPLPAVTASTRPDVVAENSSVEVTTSPSWLLPVGSAFGAALGLLTLGWMLRRKRHPTQRCPQCANDAQLIYDGGRRRGAQATDGVSVDGGQRISSYLDDAALQLFACPVCNHHLVTPPARPAACPGCSTPRAGALSRARPTPLRTTLSTCTRADDAGPGSVSVRQTCAACSWTTERTLWFPKLTQGGRVGVQHVVGEEMPLDLTALEPLEGPADLVETAGAHGSHSRGTDLVIDLERASVRRESSTL